MPDEEPQRCSRCGATSARRIDGLCPSCLAAGAVSALTDLLQPKATEPSDLAVHIDGCEVESVLGAGAMGIVYRGIRSDTDDPIAIKVLARSFSEDAEMAERFRREAEALSSLHHENVVRVVSTGETDDGRLYLAMELVDGCDLRRLLKAERLSVERALDVFAKVCHGIEHAHEHRVIHRDIKPANILVGVDGAVKVADFGVAKAVAGSLSSFTLTQTREAFGTPYYIAPEVARQGSADERADVYALGVLLYELLTGQVPMGSFTPASKLCDLTPRIDTIIAQAMSDDATKRPASVKELRLAVERVRDWHRASARRRRTMRIALILGSTLALVAMAVGAGRWWEQQSQKPAPLPVYASPTTAAKDKPWTNSIGMKFVPIAETHLLWSVYETRRGEYVQFYRADRGLLPEWRENTLLGRRTYRVSQLTANGWVPGGQWNEPGFEQTDVHPAVGVDLRDARSFCDWLTWKELRENRLAPGMRYRLPTNDEWSLAVGFNEDTVRGKNRINFALRKAPTMPPGNFAGEEVKQLVWPQGWPVWTTSDAFPRTAPCGSFSPNEFGLYDLQGNASEWVDTMRHSLSTKGNPTFSVRGGSWASAKLEEMHPAARVPTSFGSQRADVGFRVVLEVGDEAN